MINGKIIKVCGMREAENIQDIESIEGIDMLGFIFYPKSPRCVYELPAYLPTHARRVGVFVNEDKQVVSMYADQSAHALGALKKLKFKPEDIVVLTVSGRGDKDIETYLSFNEQL